MDRMSSITRDEYGIFQSENDKWYIDAPEHIYGEYETEAEAIEQFEKAYPEVTRYVIIPYSETAEWTGEWMEEPTDEWHGGVANRDKGLGRSIDRSHNYAGVS